jgi:CRP-like cAMP-binding protein
MYALNSFHPQSDHVQDYFRQHSLLFHFSKKEMILQEGNLCECIYFIKKGVVRGFITDAGKDITTWITAEHEMVTAISSLDRSTAATENIEAIEECELIGVRADAIQQLYELYPEFNITGRKLLQQYYRDAERRALVIRLTNAEQKYLFFIEQYAHLANRIPLKYIASFLGITIETLSRVRKKIAGQQDG